VKQKLGALGTLYYNSMTAFPLALVASAAFGELSALRSFHYARDPAFWINFVICASMGPLITYSSILCTTYNSPLATSITGNVKDLGLTVVGAVIFPGFVATTNTVAGLLISFIGAGLYSWVSLKKALAPAAGAPATADAPSGGAAAASDDAEAAADSESASAASAEVVALMPRRPSTAVVARGRTA
jgi:hypothetical protein